MTINWGQATLYNCVYTECQKNWASTFFRKLRLMHEQMDKWKDRRTGWIQFTPIHLSWSVCVCVCGWGVGVGGGGGGGGGGVGGGGYIDFDYQHHLNAEKKSKYISIFPKIDSILQWLISGNLLM